MKLNKIKKIIQENSYIKYIIVFLLVFSISFGINYFLIHDLERHINEKQIYYEDFSIKDSYISDNDIHDFIIIGDNNKSYEIINDKDGVDLYNRLEKNKTYHFILRNDSNCKYPHIIQVYDERK